jgi:uncharacterized protein YggU (UPF0235/DUF167 family)
MIIAITVKPGTKRSEIVAKIGMLTAYLRSRPVDGRANEELIDLLTEYYDVAPSKIHIKSGFTSHKKRVEIITA